MKNVFCALFLAVATAFPAWADSDCIDQDDYCDLDCVPDNCVILWDTDLDRCVWG